VEGRKWVRIEDEKGELSSYMKIGDY